MDAAHLKLKCLDMSDGSTGFAPDAHMTYAGLNYEKLELCFFFFFAA